MAAYQSTVDVLKRVSGYKIGLNLRAVNWMPCFIYYKLGMWTQRVVENMNVEAEANQATSPIYVVILGTRFVRARAQRKRKYQSLQPLASQSTIFGVKLPIVFGSGTDIKSNTGSA